MTSVEGRYGNKLLHLMWQAEEVKRSLNTRERRSKQLLAQMRAATILQAAVRRQKLSATHGQTCMASCTLRASLLRSLTQLGVPRKYAHLSTHLSTHRSVSLEDAVQIKNSKTFCSRVMASRWLAAVCRGHIARRSHAWQMEESYLVEKLSAVREREKTLAVWLQTRGAAVLEAAVRRALGQLEVHQLLRAKWLEIHRAEEEFKALKEREKAQIMYLKEALSAVRERERTLAVRLQNTASSMLQAAVRRVATQRELARRRSGGGHLFAVVKARQAQSSFVRNQRSQRNSEVSRLQKQVGGVDEVEGLGVLEKSERVGVVEEVEGVGVMEELVGAVVVEELVGAGGVEDDVGGGLVEEVEGVGLVEGGGSVDELVGAVVVEELVGAGGVEDDMGAGFVEEVEGVGLMEELEGVGVVEELLGAVGLEKEARDAQIFTTDTISGMVSVSKEAIAPLEQQAEWAAAEAQEREIIQHAVVALVRHDREFVAKITAHALQEQAALTEKRVCCECALEKTAEATVEALATEPSQECDTATLFDSDNGRSEENDAMTATAVVVQGDDQEQKQSHESVEKEARQAVSVFPPSLSLSLCFCFQTYIYTYFTHSLSLSHAGGEL